MPFPSCAGLSCGCCTVAVAIAAAVGAVGAGGAAFAPMFSFSQHGRSTLPLLFSRPHFVPYAPVNSPCQFENVFCKGRGIFLHSRQWKNGNLVGGGAAAAAVVGGVVVVCCCCC